MDSHTHKSHWGSLNRSLLDPSQWMAPVNKSLKPFFPALFAGTKIKRNVEFQIILSINSAFHLVFTISFISFTDFQSYLCFSFLSLNNFYCSKYYKWSENFYSYLASKSYIILAESFWSKRPYKIVIYQMDDC